MAHKNKKLLIVLLFIVFVVLNNPETLAVSFYEKYVSRANFKELRNKYKIYTLKEESQYMKVFKKLKRKAERDNPDLDFKLYYIDSPIINAYYIGDGNIMVFRGLLELLENEDQIAAVIGHEMGHGVKEHIDQQLETSIKLNIIGWLFNQITKEEYGNLTDFAANLLSKGFSRDQEKEADLYSVELINKAGYNPRGAIELMQIFKKVDGSIDLKLLELFKTHPNPGTRLEYISEYIEKNIANESSSES